MNGRALSRIGPWSGTVARLLLGGVLLWAGAAKLADLAAARGAVAAYRIVPAHDAGPIGSALASVEITLGVLLVAGLATRLAAVVTTGLFGIYVAAIASAWARGLSIDCGCFGGGGAVANGAVPGYVRDLLRDVALLALAALLIWRPQTRYGLDGRVSALREVPLVGPADTAVRQAVLRRHLRRRSRLVSLVAVGFLALAVPAGVTVYHTRLGDQLAVPDRVPAGATTDSAGLLVSSGPVRVDIYHDYLCPSCRSVESTLAPALDSLRRAGTIALVHHPLGHLDGYSQPHGYSTRAASAAGCAADHGKVLEYSQALFADQPQEGSPGLSDDELISVATRVGITAPSFAACVHAHTYRPWARYVTETAYAHDITSTPTILVAGKPIDVGAADVTAELTAAVRAAGPQ